jgi:hypothetical protein
VQRAPFPLLILFYLSTCSSYCCRSSTDRLLSRPIIPFERRPQPATTQTITATTTTDTTASTITAAAIITAATNSSSHYHHHSRSVHKSSLLPPSLPTAAPPPSFLPPCSCCSSLLLPVAPPCCLILPPDPSSLPPPRCFTLLIPAPPCSFPLAPGLAIWCDLGRSSTPSSPPRRSAATTAQHRMNGGAVVARACRSTHLRSRNQSRVSAVPMSSRITCIAKSATWGDHEACRIKSGLNRGLQLRHYHSGGSQRLGVAHMGDKDPYLKGWRNGASVASSGHYPPKSDCCCSWQPNSRRRAAIMLQPARNTSRVRCRAVVDG